MPLIAFSGPGPSLPLRRRRSGQRRNAWRGMRRVGEVARPNFSQIGQSARPDLGIVANPGEVALPASQESPVRSVEHLLHFHVLHFLQYMGLQGIALWVEREPRMKGKGPQFLPGSRLAGGSDGQRLLLLRSFLRISAYSLR